MSIVFFTDAEEIEFLLAGGADGGFNPKWALGLWTYESGLNKREGLGDPKSPKGINQFIRATLKEMGYAGADFAAESLITQMTYTFRMWAYWKKKLQIPTWQSRAHLYVSTFYPMANSGDYDDEKVILTEAGAPMAYKANRNLDRDGDRAITMDEMELAIQQGIKWLRLRFALAICQVDDVANFDLGVQANKSLAGKGRGEAAQLQYHLQSLGYYLGVLDGLIGPKTEAAVAAAIADAA